MQDYTPSTRFNNTQLLWNNHFKFVIRDWPDLSQFVTAVVLPAVGAPSVGPHFNPFVGEPHVSDHMLFSPLTIQFLVDAKFLTYYSLFHWMTGFGFPTGYEDIAQFYAFRKKQLANPRPLQREIFKTGATLYLLTPDTDAPMVEIEFEDIFPTQLGDLSFTTTSTDTQQLTCMATFAYTRFEPKLVLE
jgi:hypothetical protein